MYREKVIIELIKDKKVLDIGSIGQSDEYCLWNLLSKHCKSITGIDLPNSVLTSKNILSVNDSGLCHQNDKRIIYGNMESINLNDKFDVVIAGDVLEHVSNQGLFLDNIHKHLKNFSKLIITTPNAKWPTVFLRPNPTHTLWHDRYTLATLLNRHHFKINKINYYYGNKKHYSCWKIPFIYRQSILIIAEKI